MKKFSLLILLPLLLAGCTPEGGTVTPEVDPTPDPSDPVDPVDPGDDDPVDPGDDDPVDPPPTPPTEKIYTIAEIIDLCNELTPATDNIGITTSDTNVKFVAQAIDGIDTLEGYSGTTPIGKVVLADSTGYILGASDMGSQSQSTLYRNFVNNKTKRNSKYTLTGNIGLYRGQPEVVITSFVWDENLDVTYDVSSLSVGEIENVPEFYETTIAEADYNSKGHGIGKIHSMSNMKCLGKADDNSWIFTDESKRIMGVYDFISNTSFTAGVTYNITGMVTTHQWKPSLRVLEYERVNDAIVADPYDEAVSKTIQQVHSFKRPDVGDKDYRRYPDYLRAFQYIYTTDVYLTVISDKPYAGDTYQASGISTKEVAASKYYSTFNNEDFNFANLNDYYGVNESLTIYYSLYQQDQITYNKTKYKPWKIYLFKDMLEIE